MGLANSCVEKPWGQHAPSNRQSVCFGLSACTCHYMPSSGILGLAESRQHARPHWRSRIGIVTLR